MENLAVGASTYRVLSFLAVPLVIAFEITNLIRGDNVLRVMKYVAAVKVAAAALRQQLLLHPDGPLHAKVLLGKPRANAIILASAPITSMKSGATEGFGAP